MSKDMDGVMQRWNRHLGLMIFFVGLSLTTVQAQPTQTLSGYHWMFGQGNQGIRFNRVDQTPTTIAHNPLGIGGSATVSQAYNGDLLFYTDGQTVYDQNGLAMPNGTGLNGSPTASQGVVVAQVPGSANQYFVVTRSGAGAIAFSVVDMTLFGNATFPNPATGDVLTKNQAVAMPGPRSDGMIFIPHANGNDVWLVTHTTGSADYAVTLFTATGPTTTTNFIGAGLIQDVNSLAWNPATSRLAVAPAEARRDIEVFSFDRATGALISFQTVLNSGVNTTTEFIYDVEWSPNGQYLYYSISGDVGLAADLVQYDLLSPTTTLASVLPAAIHRSYGLQLGPDSTIYHLYQATAGGAFLLGRIQDPDSVATLTRYQSQVFTGINFNGRQFSATPPLTNQPLNVTFTSVGTCANSPISFYPVVTPAADSLVWDLGDGSGSTEWSPVHTYTAGGTYTVNVTAFLNGQSAVSSQAINLTDFNLQISLPSDTTACSCELPFPKADPPPPACPTPFSITAQVSGGSASLQWFGPSGLLTGETSATLAPDSAGYYYVVATLGGCQAYAGVNIREYGVEDQRANIWYFGNLAGIDFNPLPENPPVAITNPVMNAPEGTSTISDRNGQVVFYTDGDKVWNRLNQEIATGIGGNLNSTQSALIMPVQGDETLYYIFTTEEIRGTNTYNLKYSLFDLKLNNGLGGIVQQNITLFSRSTERITAANNWLIAHEYGNNSFRSYQITTAGISAPVISSIGSDHTLASVDAGEGYMKIGSNLRLAVALSQPGTSNVIELFDFIDSSGVITNYRPANTKQNTGKLYGVEFSPGGNKLFATLQEGTTSRLVEFFLDSLGMPYLRTPGLAPVSGQLGAIQTGPDGQVYVAIEGSNALGVILVNEDTTAQSVFNANGFVLAGGSNSRLGLPNFVQTLLDPIQGPSAVVAGFCLGSETTFTGTGTDIIDEFQWFFGDGQSANTQDATHTYAAAGNYLVTLRVFNRCGLDTLISQTITINAPPAAPTFLPAGQVPVLCNGPITLEATPATNPNLSNLNFLWASGDTTRTVVADVQNLYSVTITDNNGCTSSGAVVIADNRPRLDLGPDLTICQGTPQFPLDAQNNAPGTTYVWRLNSAIIGNTRTQSVDTSLPTITPNVYEVTIVDGFGCSLTEDIAFTIKESPVLTVTANNPTSCTTPTGSIQVTVSSPTTTLFQYSLSGGTTSVNFTDQAPGAMPLVPNLIAGTYGITIRDQASGCQTQTTATLNNITVSVSGIQTGTCDPNLAIQVTSAPAYAASITYRVFDVATSLEVPGGGTQPSGSFTTFNLPSGATYTVEVTQTATGCVASTAPITLTQSTPLTVTIDDLQLCSGTVTAISAGATTFDWSASPTGSLLNTSGPLVNVNPGTWILQVTADDGPGGLCPGTASLPVTAGTPLTPVITQGDACTDQVQITATPAGSFIYRWNRNGALDATLGGNQVLAALVNDGQTYQVNVQNPATGCTYTSNTITVNVEGAFSVDLATTLPCEGKTFTLTATPIRPASSFAWTYNGVVIPGQVTNTRIDNRGGVFGVTATSAICPATAEITITLGPVTPGNLLDLGRICPDPSNPDPTTREITLDPGTFQAYNWYKDGVVLGVVTPTLTVNEAGIFSVDLTNAFGCVSTDRTDVVVDCEPVITGPNAFRPGSQLISNQQFQLFTFFISDDDFEVSIFNRWGEMVFTSRDRLFAWNGGLNNSGALLPPGTYSYVVRFKSSYRPEEGIQEFRGGVVLVR